MNVEHILSFVSVWSVLLPFVVGFFFFTKLSKNALLIFIIVTVAIVPQVISAFDLKSGDIKNILYNAYTPIEFLIFYILFAQYINHKREKLLYKVIGVLYIVVSICFIINKDFTKRFFDEWACINNLSYTLWILVVFYKQYAASDTIKIDTSTSAFWIMTGLLFYATCATLYFSVYHYAQETNYSSLKIIHHFVNANMYVCFTIAIYKDSKKTNTLKAETNKKVFEKNVVAN